MYRLLILLEGLMIELAFKCFCLIYLYGILNFTLVLCLRLWILSTRFLDSSIRWLMMLILQLVLVGFVFLFPITSPTNTSRHICKYSTNLAWIRVVWPLTSSKTWPSNLSYVSKSVWSVRYFVCPDRHNLKDSSLVVLTCSFERAWLTQKRHWMIDIDDADISGCMIIVFPVMWIFAVKLLNILH